MHTGFFITMEGIDGVGKSTQMALLTANLRARFDATRGVMLTKEPGDANAGSIIGAKVRDIVFNQPGTKNMAPGVADMLFLADHIQNVHEIRNSLKDGQVVICDRYADSQFAYSASASKKTPAWANVVYSDQYGILPDLILLLVARGPKQLFSAGSEDISWALARANARRGAEAGKQDGKAWNAVEDQRKIQNAYLRLLRAQQRTVIIDVYEDSSIETIHEMIMTAVNSALVSYGTGNQLNLPLVEQVQAA